MADLIKQDHKRSQNYVEDFVNEEHEDIPTEEIAFTKRAMDIVSGKANGVFDSQKRMKEFREIYEPQNDNKPPDLKEDFNQEK